MRSVISRAAVGRQQGAFQASRYGESRRLKRIRQLCSSEHRYRSSLLIHNAAFTATRTYANEPSEGASTKGTPGAASNVKEPPTSAAPDPESARVNSGRGREGSSPDTKGVAQPVSNVNVQSVQDEPSPAAEHAKGDPSESAEQKRKYVEEAGNEPLDPADNGFGKSNVNV